LPFSLVEYKISSSGDLLVKSKARASKIICDNSVQTVDFEEWFNTLDKAECVGGRYYLLGRKDDLIVSSSGENINPQIVENAIRIEEVNEKCLIKGENGAVLVLELGSWLPVNKLQEIEERAKQCLKDANLEKEIKQIVLTRTKLLEENDFKVNRRKIAKKLSLGVIKGVEIVEKSQDEEVSELEGEIICIFKEVLGSDASVSVNDDFFMDLNGTSLDYFQLIAELRNRFSLRQDLFEGKGLTTVKQLAEIIIKELN
jgi:long-subunit acyl-CoA synthetase (AMP-forming)